MKRHLTLSPIAVVLGSLFLPSFAAAQEDYVVRLSWLVHQDISWEVVRPGQCRHLLVETAAPAYVAVFEWTPDDELILLQPFRPDRPVRFAGTAPEPIRTSPYEAYCWSAGSDRPNGPGLGYLVAIASPEPMDLTAGMDALGVLRRWGGGNFTARGVTFNPDDAFDILLEALGADEEATSVLGYAIAR